MAMVKAFSYGSGSAEIARVLQYNKVDYLAVAYTDEGIDLRKAGISLPIMVMNVEEDSFTNLVEYNLEPEVYSFNILHKLTAYLQQQGIETFPIHLKVNTGMNRLGFEVEDAEALVHYLTSNKSYFVKSIFSHLVASGNEAFQSFTKYQQQLFASFASAIEKGMGYTTIKHLANTSAISQDQSLAFDMVRLGIGLYGVDDAMPNLQTVASLKTTIAQLRKVKKGESVGYNRACILQKDSVIATIRIGYADGLSRQLGNGKGNVYINGVMAPIVGNVCMDMTMIDVTHIPNISEEDEVEIFGIHLPVQQIAAWSNTIAYETLSTINQRVKRIYVQE
jgi:alanine racemase